MLVMQQIYVTMSKLASLVLTKLYSYFVGKSRNTCKK